MRYPKYYNYKKSKSIVNNDGSITLLLFLEVISFTGFAGGQIVVWNDCGAVIRGRDVEFFVEHSL
jgi:hypothetical protein